MCNNIPVILFCVFLESVKCLCLICQLVQCGRVADDDRLLAAGAVASSLPVQSLSHGPGRSHHLGPVVGNVLVVRIMRTLQFLGANVAEHDAKGEEAEHANHQEDVHDSLRLRVGPGSRCVVHSLLGRVVLRQRRRQYSCAVEPVLQEGEQERLQLGGVDVRHG